MRNIRTAVATFAATGLAALGAIAASGGVANASQNLSITGCSVDHSLVSAQVFPSCEAADGTIYNPTEITVSVDRSFFDALAPHLNPGELPFLKAGVHYTLACSVNGHWRFDHEHFIADGRPHGGNSDTVDLQRAVGSPSPNSCQVRDLSATSLLNLSLIHTPIPNFSFAVSAQGDNGTPGTIWAQYPKNSVGSGSTVCVDDTANGNAGSAVQAFQCENDLADAWLATTDGQYVHNGDCLTQTGNGVSLEPCENHPHPGSNQVWHFRGSSASAGWLTNTNGNGCLTAPSSGTIDGTQLTVQNCTGALGQLWKVPAPTER
jgi:hypothetical protein